MATPADTAKATALRYVSDVPRGIRRPTRGRDIAKSPWRVNLFAISANTLADRNV